MKSLQKELDKLCRQGYYFMCTNSAYDPLGNHNYSPDDEYVVTIGKKGVQLPPIAVHKNLHTAIGMAIDIIKDKIAEGESKE